jgi:hypothetical protein
MKPGHMSCLKGVTKDDYFGCKPPFSLFRLGPGGCLVREDIANGKLCWCQHRLALPWNSEVARKLRTELAKLARSSMAGQMASMPATDPYRLEFLITHDHGPYPCAQGGTGSYRNPACGSSPPPLCPENWCVGRGPVSNPMFTCCHWIIVDAGPKTELGKLLALAGAAQRRRGVRK